jgi:diguanylate cyclase (GGDEF)-like protein
MRNLHLDSVMRPPPLAANFEDSAEIAAHAAIEAGNGDPAAIALSALNKLSLGVAVVGEGNRVLYRNARFAEFLGSDESPARIGDFIAVSDGAGVGDIALSGGRTFKVTTNRLPQGRLITLEDISERAAQSARAAQQARIDPVTQIGNSLLFQERLMEKLANVVPEAQPTSVLMVEVNGLDAIALSLGQTLGDSLMFVIAGRLRSALGAGDIVARVGGEKFAVMQTGLSQPHSAAALAKRLVDLLGRSYLLEGHLLTIGASVGIALSPADGETYDQVLKNANLALDRAQQEGRGAFRFFERAMDSQMSARRSLENGLRRALALREFALVYQPQFNIANWRITGFEALLRWRDPERGFVSPAEFIPLAEEIGLIVPIGEWVVRVACKEAAGWPMPLRAAVNVSALQFVSPNLVPTILSALAESGLDPHRLELEITESVMLGDKGAVLEVLSKLREMGVRVSMDDFGTGYSSLSSLRRFPFEKIKIDQSFVRGDPDDPSGAAIVRAIAALGRSLGMSTIAEGVETEEQLARVIDAGCTDVQGYLISRPLSPEKIVEFLGAPIAGVSAAAMISDEFKDRSSRGELLYEG